MYKNPLLHWVSKIYHIFIFGGEYLQTIFLLYMRVTWGHQFFVIGLGKLQNMEKTIQGFISLHIPHPELHSYLVGYTEMICGFLIFIGLASRIASIPLIITMLVALSIAHGPEISEFKFLLEPMSLVKQPPYPFLITAIMIFCFGPGKVAVDAWVKRWVSHQPKY